MPNHRFLWTRSAFIASLPKCCLACQSQSLSYKDRDIVQRGAHGTVVLGRYPVALCMRFEDCGAAYAQHSDSSRRYGSTGFFCGGIEVRFVDSLPYHIPFDAMARAILDKNQFARPGQPYSQGVIDTALPHLK